LEKGQRQDGFSGQESMIEAELMVLAGGAVLESIWERLTTPVVGKLLRRLVIEKLVMF
jgi:hypothetical protein